MRGPWHIYFEDGWKPDTPRLTKSPRALRHCNWNEEIRHALQQSSPHA